MADKPDIIIDIGSGYVKAGFSGEKEPRAVFPTLVGRPKVAEIMVGNEQKNYLIGQEAEEKREGLLLNHPVKHGSIEDWEDWEKILDYTFTNELRVMPEEHNVMIIETPLNSKVNREKLTKLMFDRFNIPCFYIATNATLAIYTVGQFTGLVVDSGEGVTHTVSIFDGYPLPHSILRSKLAGKDLTDHLLKLLSERGLHLTPSAEQEIVRDIKEKTGYVALDFEDELRQWQQGASKEATYELPDGSVITIGSERFRAPEALFQPSLIGQESAGIHNQIYQSIQKSDVDVRNELYQNIILAGGTTLFPGLPERLAKEVQKFAPQHLRARVKVIAIPERKYSPWVGGSILTSTSTFASMWITKDEYEDAGPTIVHRKCF